MRGLVSSDVIEQIRSTSDIVEIIGEYITLKKAGKDYKGLCSFHSEKTPSFTVSPEKQIYHCFGCGEGGNVFNFLMKFSNLTFPEAVAQLAAKNGITIHEITDDGKQKARPEFSQNERDKYFELNRLAAEYFHNKLTKDQCGKAAREYLQNRNISSDTINKFFVGYADKNWDSLLNYFKEKNFYPQFIGKAGLVKLKESGTGFYDRFRDRIIFPIISTDNKICGFGGRVISPDGKAPKYINSPDSIIYNKGKILFGFNLARESIRKNNFILVVEGYFDLISLYQYGFKNAVATCGTALTKNQAALIKRYTNNVILLFDSDEAGFKASSRGFEILLEQSLNVKVVDLPDNMDPDSFVNQFGKIEFHGKITQSLPFIEFLANKITKNINLNSLEERVNGINTILPFLAKIENSIERNGYLTKLAEKFHVSEKSILDELRKAIGQKRTKITLNNNMNFKKHSLDWSERNLIRLIILNPENIENVKNRITADYFSDDILKNIAGFLFGLSIPKDQLSPQKVVGLLPSNNYREVITRLLMEEIEFDNIDVVLEDCVQTIAKRANQKKIENIKKQRIQAASLLKIDDFNKLNEDLKSMQ